MFRTTIEFTYDEFLEALNHQAFVASQITLKNEMASYGFIALLLVTHSITVIHPNASLGCFPQIEIAASNETKYPDFGSLLCSCVKDVTTPIQGALRTWWEIKRFNDLNAATDESIYDEFEETFSNHLKQFRAQAAAAFNAFPAAERFLMIVSQGLRFALLEWPNPRMKEVPKESPWNWVRGQEKNIYAKLEKLKKEMFEKEDNLQLAQRYQRAESLLNDPSAYLPPRNSRQRVEFNNKKSKISKCMKNCKKALRPEHLVRVIYFAEPMFTLSDQVDNTWRRITGLTSQFRDALRATCRPPDPKSPEFTFKPSFFEPPASSLQAEIAIPEGALDIIAVAEFHAFEGYIQGLTDESFKILDEHRAESASDPGSESPSDGPEESDSDAPSSSSQEEGPSLTSSSEAVETNASEFIPSHGEGDSESIPSSPIATRKSARVTRTRNVAL